MSWLDLHLHSSFSDDGEFSPTRLALLCWRAGIGTAALADHNTTRGVPAMLKAGRALGVEVIPAVELDCTHEGVDLHLLGYWIDPAHPGFARAEESVLSQEQTAAGRRIELVRACGIPLDLAAVTALSKDGIVTGEMIAEVALAMPENAEHPLLSPYRPGGARSDNPYVNFYWDFCAQGKPAYVPIRFPSLAEAVALVREAGGLPVLAHPGNNIHEDAALLQSIVRCGVAGLEAYSSYHTPAQTAFYLRQAEALGLAVTCGSDFHGKIKPAIRLGSAESGGREAALLGELRKKLDSLEGAR